MRLRPVNDLVIAFMPVLLPFTPNQLPGFDTPAGGVSVARRTGWPRETQARAGVHEDSHPYRFALFYPPGLLHPGGYVKELT
jgi:hypothetical protein